MKIDSLEKLYEDHLASLKNGDEQQLELLPKLLSVVSHAQLRDSIRDLIPRVRAQAGRLEEILPANTITQQGGSSPGMKGIIDEGHQFLERAGEENIIDAGILSLLQRILHYSMSRYGAVRTYAELLGKEEQAQQLQRSLDEQKESDEHLTHLALDVINVDAQSATSG